MKFQKRHITYRLNKIIALLFVFHISISSLYSQEKTIKGKIISEYFESVPFASIMFNDTVEIGKTDLNGNFEILVSDSIKQIQILNAGFDKAIIEPQEGCEKTEIVLFLSGTYDFISLKKVDKKRRRKFNTLLQMHQEAFSEGIFEAEQQCYHRIFEPIYFKQK